MPNPKNYMDDDHSYVSGYVRRKHKDEEGGTQEGRGLTLFIAVLILALIVAIIVGFIQFR